MKENRAPWGPFESNFRRYHKKDEKNPAGRTRLASGWGVWDAMVGQTSSLSPCRPEKWGTLSRRRSALRLRHLPHRRIQTYDAINITTAARLDRRPLHIQSFTGICSSLHGAGLAFLMKKPSAKVRAQVSLSLCSRLDMGLHRQVQGHSSVTCP